MKSAWKVLNNKFKPKDEVLFDDLNKGYTRKNITSRFGLVL